MKDTPSEPSYICRHSNINQKMYILQPNVNNIYENKDKDLVMINVEKKDQGPYQCTATNVFGTDTFTVLLQVKGTYTLVF